MADESTANWISENLQHYHFPYDMVFGTFYSSATSHDSIYYDDAGDSALWTGVYLAAESFRYFVTRSPDALANVQKALNGIRKTSQISGNGLLARCVFPKDGLGVDYFKSQEGRHGIYEEKIDGEDYYWVDNGSRDQYAGVFFGLAVAHELVDQPDVESLTRGLVTSLVIYLLDHWWTPKDPHSGKLSTTFLHRPDMRLAILQIARHVAPDQKRFSDEYKKRRRTSAWLVPAPVWYECRNPYDSYFKFNLIALYLYNLIRLEQLEDPQSKYLKHYRKAFRKFRETTKDHGNAHFNMIDCALNGLEAKRDQETIELLDLWISRGLRRKAVDNPNVKVCGKNRACDPIPVDKRPCAGFLWEVTPFQIAGDGNLRLEYAGVDYLLPYWMARYHDVLKSTPRMAARLVRLCCPSRARMDVTMTASDDAGMTVTSLTVTMTDRNGTDQHTRMLTEDELAVLLGGTSHLEAGGSGTISDEAAYPGDVDTRGSTGRASMTVTDDRGDTSTHRFNVTFQHDGC